MSLLKLNCIECGEEIHIECKPGEEQYEFCCGFEYHWDGNKTVHVEDKKAFKDSEVEKLVQDEYDRLAEKAWEKDPKAAFRKFGLPCYCGHYGGCEKCYD